MGVNVPEFLGKLEGGIKNLETVTKIYEQSPDKVPGDIIVSAYDLLARGYLKNKEEEKAKLAWGKVIELAPETSLAEVAHWGHRWSLPGGAVQLEDRRSHPAHLADLAARGGRRVGVRDRRHLRRREERR